MKSATNVAAKPEAPLARLQSTTASPMIIQREKRSESQPRAGAASMYVTRNAVPSVPVIAIAFWLFADEKRRTNLRFHRRQNLAIDVVEQVDPEQQRERGPCAGVCP